MSIGLDYKKYYLVTSITVSIHTNKHVLEFINDPINSSNANFYESMISKEVGMVERQTGAKFCHLYYKRYSIPFQLRFIFDMGLQNSNFKNKMKMKMPDRINQIFEDDSDYIMRLKQVYKDSEIFKSIYKRDGYDIFIFEK